MEELAAIILTRKLLLFFLLGQVEMEAVMAVAIIMTAAVVEGEAPS